MEVKRMDLISSIAMSTAILIASISASTAYAVDGKNYPGSMCVRWNGGTPVYDGSSIGNSSPSTPLYLDCPAVKDATNIRSGWVRVIDRHYSENVRCNLVVSETIGTGHPLGWQSSNGSNNQQQILRWNSGAGAQNHSYYYYSCVIPPAYNGARSYINSYQVQEND